MQTRQSAPPLVDDAVIRVRNVRKRFGKGDPTIHDLYFDVQRGTIFCLLGPSGSGKSTTMRMLTGVYKPTEGEMRVLGVEPHNVSTNGFGARIGYMPQQFVLFPELTTLENINFVASVYGMSWFGRDAKRCEQALEFVDLWEARNKLASQLSGGMQRRLELASTLVHNPDVLFVDEPTAGHRPYFASEILGTIQGIARRGPYPFCHHSICDRGRLLRYGCDPEPRTFAGVGHTRRSAEASARWRHHQLETGRSDEYQPLRILRSIPDMLRVQIISNEDLRLTVTDSSAALQEIVHTFQENNIPIQSIEPYRPNFEEIFVQLLESDTPVEPEDEKVHEKKDKQRHDHIYTRGVTLAKNVQKMSAEDFLEKAATEALKQRRLKHGARHSRRFQRFGGTTSVPGGWFRLCPFTCRD